MQHVATQLSLWGSEQEKALTENPAYLSEQLITYIGNKRSLLEFLNAAIMRVKERLGREKLSCVDLFSGSGVVSRYLKRHSNHLIVNDLEKYAEVIARCYLTNCSEVPHERLEVRMHELKEALSEDKLRPGFIRELYAPADEFDIKPGERVFYTPRNAMYLDTARQLIAGIEPELQHYFLAPLLAEASVHTNTSGVFKGFYKNADGIGQYGGNKGDALVRIKGEIELQLPVLSNFECTVDIYREDANRLVKQLPHVDLAYLDPPYNQHPYGSNYFMLNLLVDYQRPETLSQVSGIPVDWNRSDYNRRSQCFPRLQEVVEALNARFVLISFNSEGFVSYEEMIAFLMQFGEVTTFETQYNTFRGSRNLRNRDVHVKEHLYLLEKR